MANWRKEYEYQQNILNVINLWHGCSCSQYLANFVFSYCINHPKLRSKRIRRKEWEIESLFSAVFVSNIIFIQIHKTHTKKVNKYVYVRVQDTGWLHFLLLFNFFFSFLPRKCVFFFISLCYDPYTRINKKMFHVNQFLLLKFT